MTYGTMTPLGLGVSRAVCIFRDGLSDNCQ